jgi:hypothetical protein
MTRIALIALGVLLLLGVVVSIWPVNNREAMGEVRLEGVSLELYPAADPDAKWLFQAKNVVYNPDTRESEVELQGKGRRVVDGKTDLELSAKSLTIDGNDNLRTTKASVYVPRDCATVSLTNTRRDTDGQTLTSPNFVMIDQNTGYRAPYAEITFPDYRQTGENLDASFDLKERLVLERTRFRLVDGGNERCENGVIVKKEQ